MAETPTTFVADPALRLDAPQRPRPRARLVAAVLAALLLESGVLAIAWFERSLAPAPPEEAIPVEIVTEPPPPPPPPPPQPTPSAEPQPQPQEVEKPATDAPREGKSDHDDDTVAEKEKPAPAPPPPAPTPSPEATQPAAAPPAPELPKAAEAEAPAPAKETPAPAAKPKPSVADVLAKTTDTVPEVDFGGAAIKSDVTGGAAKSSFLTKLFGLIVPRFHVPGIARAYGRELRGVAVMEIDGRGRLMGRGVREGSGSMELDEAAMEAIGAASKSFPAPPQRATVYVEWHYSSAD